MNLSKIYSNYSEIILNWIKLLIFSDYDYGKVNLRDGVM